MISDAENFGNWNGTSVFSDEAKDDFDGEFCCFFYSVIAILQQIIFDMMF